MLAESQHRQPELAWRRLARLAFGLVVVLSPFRAAIVVASHPVPPLYASYTDLLVTAGDIAMFATVALWLLSLAADRRPVSFGPRFLTWPVAGLVVMAWISAATSIDPSISLNNAADLVLLAGLALYVRNEVSVRTLAGSLTIMVGIQALVAVGQFLVQGSVGLAALGELHLDPAVAGVSVVATSGTDRLLRAYGLTDHPNILGGLLAFALPLLIVSVPRAGVRTAIPTVAAFSLGALALLLTFSRAAWLALAIALGIGAAMLVRVRPAVVGRTWAVTAIGTAAICALVAIPYARFFLVRADLLDPQVATEVMSTGERTILVDATRDIVAAHPLTGTGMATLPLAIMQARPGLTFDFQPAPVVLLDVAAEIGVVGAACYVWLLVAPWIALWRSRWSGWTAELAAVSASLAAVTVVGLFDYYTWTFAPGRIWAWLLLGLWGGAYARATAGRLATSPATARPADRPSMAAHA